MAVGQTIPMEEPTPAYSILTSFRDSTPGRKLCEFNSDGTLCRTLFVPYTGPVTVGVGDLQDIAVDEEGVVHIFNSNYFPQMTSFHSSTGAFSHMSFPGWDVAQNCGGLATYKNFVYATDMAQISPGFPNGIVRFDTAQNTANRFASGIDFIDLNMGLDGMLYGLWPGGTHGGSTINVYDPETMAFVRQLPVPVEYAGTNRSIAVDQYGRIYMCGNYAYVYRLSPIGAVELRVDAKITNQGSTDIDVDREGHLIMAYPTTASVIVSDTSLTQFKSFRIVSLPPTGFISPFFVAFSPPLDSSSSLKLKRVVSRKIHGEAGTFEVDLPTAGSPGIECRNDGSNRHTVVLKFSEPLASVGQGSMSNYGSWISAGIGPDPHEYIFAFTAPNGRTVTFNLLNVTDVLNNYVYSVSASVKILRGDSSANGFVSAADVSQVKSEMGNDVINANFRTDLNADGAIDAIDLSIAKSNSGQ